MLRYAPEFPTRRGQRLSCTGQSPFGVRRFRFAPIFLSLLADREISGLSSEARAWKAADRKTTRPEGNNPVFRTLGGNRHSLARTVNIGKRRRILDNNKNEKYSTAGSFTRGYPDIIRGKYSRKYTMAQHRFDPDFTDHVIESMGPRASPRLRQLMTGLIRHVHDFARENELTVDEWMSGVRLLNWAGKMSDDKRNEGQLICDVIGLES